MDEPLEPEVIDLPPEEDYLPLSADEASALLLRIGEAGRRYLIRQSHPGRNPVR